MGYDVIFSNLAEEQIQQFVDYLINTKKNIQAARNLMNDIEDTKESLSLIADSLGYCKDKDLRAKGYKIMFFRHHRYLWIYQVANGRVEVKAMYHQLQDYENTFKSERREEII